MPRAAIDEPPFPASNASPAALAAITFEGTDFVALLEGESGVESAHFANHPGGYDAWDAWLAARGIARVRACMVATGAPSEDLATYLSETGHEVRLVEQRPVADSTLRVLLDLAAHGEGRPFAPPDRFACPERYARVSWR